MKKYLMHIGGEDFPSESGEWFESYNPFTTEPWSLIPRGNDQDADKVVNAASDAFTKGEWPQLSATSRGILLRRVGDLIAEKAEELARTEVVDNGKLISEMLAQLKYIPQWFYYFGGMADKIEGSVIPIDKKHAFNFTRYEPLGVCVGITAWNSPILIATWKLAPALAAGNTVIIKPSEFASASIVEFVQLFKQAGFPAGVVNVVTGFGAEIGEALVKHPLVAKVAFTGGSTGGQKVYETAASSMKPVTLELGGKSPNIVFKDAQLSNATKGVISGIFAASGQTCIAGSRVLVHDSIHDDFVEGLVKLAKTAKMGDPLLFETQIGPITTKSQFEKILNYFKIASDEGATCVLGGKKADCDQGWFIEPTIYTDVTPEMRIAREEIFGPILSVLSFHDDEEALQIANDTPYGLAAGVWTQDMKRALDFSTHLQAGTVWVNTYRALSFLSPFGGYKQSGIGRENGSDAIYSYLQAKSVWISTEEEVPNPFIMRL